MKTLKTAFVAAAVLAFSVAMATGNHANPGKINQNNLDTVPKKDTTKKDTSNTFAFQAQR